ncbi:MAG: type 4a pilus biogenesis protein PilO [Bacillota bacterium]
MDYLSHRLKVRKPILYLLLLIILLSCYNFVVKKEISFIQETRMQIEQLDSELILIEQKIKGIEPHRLKEMELRTSEFKRQYDLGLESQLVLLDVSKYGTEAGLDILSFESQERVDLQEFKHRTYTMAFKGSYSEFLSWLKLMEQMPYYINIKDLSINKQMILEENKQQVISEELVFKVTINNIALEGTLKYEEANPEYFREEPFEPGIVKGN